MGSISGQGTKTPHDWGLRSHVSWVMPPHTQKTKGLSYLLWTVARQEVNRNRGVGERNVDL